MKDWRRGGLLGKTRSVGRLEERWMTREDEKDWRTGGLNESWMTREEEKD